jgi:hypothetical protein
MVLYQLFDVSDVKYAGYDVVELETLQINSGPGEGESPNFEKKEIIDKYTLGYAASLFK